MFSGWRGVWEGNSEGREIREDACGIVQAEMVCAGLGWWSRPGVKCMGLKHTWRDTVECDGER